MKKYKCKFPNCFNLVDKKGEYCSEHKQQGKQLELLKEKSKREYDIKRLNSLKKNPLRRTSNWQKVRKMKLMQQPYCAICGSTENLEVHHINKPYDNADLFFNLDNLIVLCKECHKKITLEQLNKERYFNH